MKEEIEQPRRLRRLNLSYNRVLSLAMRQPINTTLELIQFDLPDDARVIAVHNCPFTGEFSFVIESEQFEELSEGMELPITPAILKIVRLEIKENNNGLSIS